MHPIFGFIIPSFKRRSASKALFKKNDNIQKGLPGGDLFSLQIKPKWWYLRNKIRQISFGLEYFLHFSSL